MVGVGVGMPGSSKLDRGVRLGQQCPGPIPEVQATRPVPIALSWAVTSSARAGKRGDPSQSGLAFANPMTTEGAREPELDR